MSARLHRLAPWMVRALVLVLVPVVWLGYHAPAAQAATYGDPTSGGFKAGLSSEVPTGDDVTCTLKGHWTVDSLSYALGGGWACSTGYNVSDAVVSVHLGTGPHACGSLGASLGQVDGNGSGTWSMGAAAAVPAGCRVETLCYSAEVRTHTMFSWEDTEHLSGCFDFPAGEPPEAAVSTTGCPGITVNRPTVVWTSADQPSDPYRSMALQGLSIQSDKRNVINVLVWGTTNAGTPYIMQNWEDEVYAGPNTRNRTASGAFGEGHVRAILGVQVTITTAVPAPNKWQPGYNVQWNHNRYAGSTTDERPHGGLTWPAHCTFYWGPQIAAEHPGGWHKPAGPLTDDGTGGGGGAAPDTTPDDPAQGDPCQFKLTDPTTWASAGICQLVRLIEALVRTVKRLPGAIADAIGALFIPTDVPDFTDVASPLPDGWAPEMPNLANSACGPVEFPQIALGWQDWTVGPVEFMSTCAHPWPLVRSLTYYGLLCMVLVGAVWTAFRVITGGLGMGVSSGSDGGDDS